MQPIRERGRAYAANTEIRVARCLRLSICAEARRQKAQLTRVVEAGFIERITRDGGDCNGYVLRLILAPLGGHDDFCKSCGSVFGACLGGFSAAGSPGCGYHYERQCHDATCCQVRPRCAAVRTSLAQMTRHRSPSMALCI